MSRFKFPFILKYTDRKDGKVTYAKEVKNNLFDFERTQDPLEATVYKSSKQFRKFFEMTATEFLRMNHVAVAYITYCEFVYVGV